MCLICDQLSSAPKDECTFRDPGQSVVGIVRNNDDASPDGLTTTNSMDIGDTFLGTLDFAGDYDVIALSLEAGETVLIEMSGDVANGIQDSFLALLNDDNLLVASNDDADFSTFDSAINFTAYDGGTYYIVADSYSAQEVGDYVISVSASEPIEPIVDTSDAPLLDDVLWGTKLDSTTINVYFAPDSFSYFEVTGQITAESWNAYERAQFDAAFALIEASVDVEFNVVNSQANADLTLVLELDDFDGLGFFNPPGESNEGTGVFNGAAWDRSQGGDLEVGGFGFVTIVHELLHGLGLAHPHDNGGTSSIIGGVSSPFDDLGDFNLNQGVFTTMSYNTGLFDGPIGDASGIGGNYSFEAGPMAIDIAALQALYGANETHNTGNTVYDMPSSNGQGTYWMSIWDAGGTDQIRYSGGNDALIDLREATLQEEVGGGGFLSGVTDVAGGFTIAQGAIIENARSGAGNDILQGNAVANTLRAGNGSDTVNGAGGNDKIFGGGGADYLYGNAGADDIYGGRGSDEIFGGRGNDDIIGGGGADDIYGGIGRDNIDGGGSADDIYGGGGSDTILGAGGNDDLNGNGGRDNIFGGTGNDDISGGNQGDRLVGGNGIDGIYGGGGNDRLVGGRGNDELSGGAGKDRLAGGAGDDLLNGGAGDDTFVFTVGMDMDRVEDAELTDTLAISANLANGLSAQDIANQADIRQNLTTIDFGNGDELVLDGTFTVSDLGMMIEIA